ncbi:MAG: hypothetical protein NC201_02395 [Prevotella sp.]|nr:hypothetical protein [Bacteroides sp.]MCM1366076.1 hypothetical protein [Prevotella sp.]MCM1436561.1 hypothetical protein [Prevotella sp.]
MKRIGFTILSLFALLGLNAQAIDVTLISNTKNENNDTRNDDFSVVFQRNNDET